MKPQLDEHLYPRCMHCKGPRVPKTVTIVQKGSRYCLEGVCSECDAKQFRFLSAADGEKLSEQYPTRKEEATPRPRKSKCPTCGSKRAIKEGPPRCTALTRGNSCGNATKTDDGLCGKHKNYVPVDSEPEEVVPVEQPPMVKKKRVVKVVRRKKTVKPDN